MKIKTCDIIAQLIKLLAICQIYNCIHLHTFFNIRFHNYIDFDSQFIKYYIIIKVKKLNIKLMPLNMR